MNPNRGHDRGAVAGGPAAGRGMMGEWRRAGISRFAAVVACLTLAVAVVAPPPPGGAAAGAAARSAWRTAVEPGAGAAGLPAEAPSPDADPGAAMVVNRRASRSEEAARATGATGAGKVVAVIDTGIDPAHPDLRTCPGGAPKVIDWVDFSGEGTVALTAFARIGAGRFGTSAGVVSAPSMSSVSGRVRYGFWRESQVEAGGPLGRDLDGDGLENGAFLVVVADSTAAGVYDTVYVDCDRDRDLNDEVPLHPFRESRSWARLGGAARAGPAVGAAFVACEVAPDGSRVVLGFDGNGHGTHVAGVAAARAGSPGGVSGVAPGAQVMALKALKSSGRGGWNRVAEAMAYAAEHGAAVICISVAGLDTPGAPPRDAASGVEMVSRLMGQLNQRYGCLFVVAAGNNGPALGSVATPGDPVAALSTGAYLAPSMWQYAYGYDVPSDELWYYSAVGPRYDGSGAPDIVAPGVAVSCVPVRYEGGGYQLLEGTSVAAAHVAGAAALLLDGARRAGMPIGAGQVREALLSGARRLPGLTPAEQGAGVMDVAVAWTRLFGALRSGRAPSGGDLRFSLGAAGGQFDRGAVPGSFLVTASNAAPEPVRARLSVDGSWLSTDFKYLSLPGRSRRQIEVRCRPLARPGLYSGSLVAVTGDGRRLGPAFSVTVAVPRRLPFGQAQGLQGRLGPAELRREYLRVEPGASLLRVMLSVPRAAAGRPAGRVRLHLFDPQGREALFTPFVGLPADECPARVTYIIVRPAAGTWEAVIYASASLTSYGAASSQYAATFEASGATVIEPAAATAARDVRAASSPGTEVPVTLDVATGAMVGEVLAVALDGPPEPPARVSISGGDEVTMAVPTVPPNAALLRVAALNPSDGACDLDLILLRLDVISGNWVEAGRAAQRGVSSEIIELVSPRAGRYSARVVATGGVNLTFEYEACAYQATRFELLGGSRRQVMPGTRWPLFLRVPPEGAGYVALLLRDAHAQATVATIPVRLEGRLPELALALLPAAGPAGETLLLEVREAQGGRPVDVVAEVGGQRYCVISGRAGIPVELAAAGTLRVVIDDPRYRRLSQTFTLSTPVGSLPGGGGDPLEEMLRRKLLEQASGGA